MNHSEKSALCYSTGSIFLALGLSASFFAHLLWGWSIDYDMASAGRIATLSGSFFWRLLTVVGILAVIIAGALDFVGGGWRVIGPFQAVILLVMEIWMCAVCLLAFRGGFEPRELITNKGPATWLCCIAVLCAVDHRRSRLIHSLITSFAWVAVGVMAYNIAVNALGPRMTNLRFLIAPIQVLMWTVPWVLANAVSKGGKSIFLGYIPAIALFVGAVLTSTRSWSCISFFYLAIPTVMRIIIRRNLVAFAVGVGAITVGALLVIILVPLFYPDLSERLLDDTRSAQLTEFMSQVSVWDLLVGKGPRGTWFWLGTDYEYLDQGYILLAFTGGVPLLASYVYLFIWPAFGALKRVDARVFAAGLTLAVWALSLSGFSIFTAPSASFVHFLICLYAGYCWGAVQSKGVFGGLPMFLDGSHWHAGCESASLQVE